LGARGQAEDFGDALNESALCLAFIDVVYGECGAEGSA